ncbi:MAG: hypothetical protein AAB575_03900 [Patescibacteria group bacterium]
MTISKKNPLYKLAYFLDDPISEKTLVGFLFDLLCAPFKFIILSALAIVFSPFILSFIALKFLGKKVDKLVEWLVIDQRFIQACKRFSQKVRVLCVPLTFTE